MLTGKAKSDFEKWYWNDWLTGSDRDYYEKDEVIQNVWKAEKLFLFPLIIEWLDSVGIRITVSYWSYTDKWQDVILGLINGNFEHDSRQQATEQAIIKANEIYNGN